MSGVLAAVIPVFLVASSGAVLRRLMILDAKTLSALNIYLLIPALVFSSLSKETIEWSLFGRFAVAVMLATLGAIVILGLIARVRDMQGPFRSAFLMTTFPNLGNFGLPVAQFAFGDKGLALAVIVMVCGSLVQNTFGLYFAQRGTYPARRALASVFQFPVLYAFALALLFQRTHWQLPHALGNAIDLTGQAAIPVQLFILGIKLAETHLDTGADVLLATVVRLGVGPLIAFACAILVGLHGLGESVFIVQMSGPVAIGMAAYGVQFDVHPRFLASVVSWTFLLSLFSVSLLLYHLMPR